MKLLLGLLVLPVLLSFENDFYSLSFSTIDGKRVETGKMKGHKILVVILPLSEKDSALKTSDLLGLQKVYDTSLIIIGIPAEETGYSKKNDQDLMKTFADRNANFFFNNRRHESNQRSKGRPINALSMAHQPQTQHSF